jgi:hypothetical protein
MERDEVCALSRLRDEHRRSALETFAAAESYFDDAPRSNAFFGSPDYGFSHKSGAPGGVDDATATRRKTGHLL